MGHGTNTSTLSPQSLSKGLNLIWNWSEKFPGSVPVTIFKEYIARVQFA